MSCQSPIGVVDETTREPILENLRLVGAELDRLWFEAAEAGSDEAITLAEAAQGVHRAIIALSPH
jgi:hypothetical protein